MTERDDDDARGVVQRFYGAVAGGGATLTRAPSGMSGAIVWRVEAGGRGWALRRWPAGASAEAIGWSHRVLAHAAGRGADFVPAPIAGAGGDSLCTLAGRLWELAPWMPGEAVADEAYAESLIAMTRTLREFHEAAQSFPLATNLKNFGPPPSIADRLRRLSEAALTDWRQVAVEAASTATGRPHAAVLQAIGVSLDKAISKANASIAPIARARSALQPVIRDARPEHFLFTGTRVTGLVDFGAMAVDSVALDLARLLGDSGVGPGLWTAALDAYGPPADVRRLVMPLAVSGVVLAGANWLRWIAAGHPPPADRLMRLNKQVAEVAAGRWPPA